MDDPTRDEEAGLPGGGGAARQRSSIPSFLFISFMLFMLTSHNGDEFLARHQYQDALRSLTYQLGNYTAWMNGTSAEFSIVSSMDAVVVHCLTKPMIQPDRDPALGVLLADFNIQGNVVNPQEASYYSNVTGFIHAAAHYHNISQSALSVNVTAPWNSHAQTYMAGTDETAMTEILGSWNWTATEKMALSVVEKLPTHSDGTTLSDTIALVHGRIELTDSITNEDLRLEFEGVHFILNGSIYGLAEPPGHNIDIRLLPSLVPISSKNETSLLIAPELSARIKKLKNLIDAGIVDQDTSSEEPPKSACPFTFYAQLHSVPVPEYLMQELEDEIQKPTGVWTISPPKLAANGLLVSRECGIMFEMNETEGLRSRTFFRKVTTYAGFSGLAYLALLILFSRQTERGRTPSGLGRVSRWIFLTQSTVDSVSFAGHITFAILAEGRPSVSLVAPAFLACVLFVYQAQFSVLIHQIQLPEDVVTPPTPTPPTPESLPVQTPPPGEANAEGPQLPSSPAPNNRTPNRPPPPPPAPTTPAAPESPSFISFFLHHVRTDPQARLCWSYLLAAFVCLQAGIVMLQEHFGPAFFLPKRYVKVKTYDYHPTLPLPDSEAPEQSLGDCAICMDAIIIETRNIASEKDWDEGSTGLLSGFQKGIESSAARRTYSLAPCSHLFHTECLEKWLAIKNICPHCRRPLPPL
ncbi:hypothetical protein DXG01_010353 [Tephrocybe rancida]|nr:hypothetical protein DXG01_010353 [Tephrocybe rancida]